MENIQTLAVKITPETYPIAVACLAGGFAAYPQEKVLGAYLVINELVPHRFHKKDRSPGLRLANSWIAEDRFNMMFTWDARKNPDVKFTPVRRK